MIRKILKKVICLLCIVLLLIILLNQGIKFIERGKVRPPGNLVEVNGEKMHVYSTGEGKNIILISGFGTVAPSLDFEPMIEELKDEFKVTVVESFGYGYSNLTDKERSAENIVEEIRMALSELNIEPPYILMPHSIGGIYSQYYASKYPNEIEGIVMLDTSMVNYFCNNKELVKPPNGRSLEVISSISNIFGVDRLYYRNIYKYIDCFNNEEKEMLEIMAVQNPFNKTMKNEASMIEENCLKVNSMDMPKDLPILKFIAIDDMNKVNEEFYKEELKYNEEEFKGMRNAKCKFIEGGHYLHYTKAKEIAKEVKELYN